MTTHDPARLAELHERMEIAYRHIASDGGPTRALLIALSEDLPEVIRALKTYCETLDIKCPKNDELTRINDQLRQRMAELNESLSNHCACEHDGRGELISECEEHRKQRQRAADLEAALESADAEMSCIRHDALERDRQLRQRVATLEQDCSALRDQRNTLAAVLKQYEVNEPLLRERVAELEYDLDLYKHRVQELEQTTTVESVEPTEPRDGDGIITPDGEWKRVDGAWEKQNDAE